MDFYNKYYKATSLIMLSMMFVTLSYYQQVVFNQVSDFFCSQFDDFAPTSINIEDLKSMDLKSSFTIVNDNQKSSKKKSNNNHVKCI